MGNVKKLLRKYNLSRYIPKNKTLEEAVYELKIELDFDDIYSCKYVPIDPPSNVTDLEGKGKTLEEAIIDLSKKINN